MGALPEEPGVKSSTTDRALASMTLRLYGAPGFSEKLTHEMRLVRTYNEDSGFCIIQRMGC